MAEPTDSERACFEAGITMGALYHQFAGTPVSEASREALEAAIEASFVHQIGIEDLEVSIRDLDPNRFEYTELHGTMLDVDLTAELEDVEVTARLRLEDGYPMMRIEEVR